MKNIKLTKQRYAVAVLIFSVIQCMILGGCMDARELKERTIIETVGIDKKDGEYLLTLQKFSPELQSGTKDVSTGAEKTTVVQTTGQTISQAIDKVTHYHGNEVFLGNSGFIVVGKKAAEDGLEDILSFLNSNYEISPEICIVMAEQSAEEIVKSQEDKGGISPAQVKNVVKQGRKNGIIGRPTIRDVLNRIKSDCAEPYLPIMKIVKNGPESAQVKIAGMAVFKDGKLKDELSIEETRGVLWGTNELEHSIIVAEFGDENKSTASVRITESKSDMKVDMQDGWPVLKLKIRSEGGLLEVKKPNGFGADISDTQKIEKAVEEHIKSTVKNTVDKVFYEDKSDVFRYSEFIKKYQPAFWKAHQSDWDNVIEHCKFIYDVKCSLDRPGLESAWSNK